MGEHEYWRSLTQEADRRNKKPSGRESATTSASGMQRGPIVPGEELRPADYKWGQWLLLASLHFLDEALACLDKASFALTQAEQLAQASSTSGATRPSAGMKLARKPVRHRARKSATDQMASDTAGR